MNVFRATSTVRTWYSYTFFFRVAYVGHGSFCLLVGFSHVTFVLLFFFSVRLGENDDANNAEIRTGRAQHNPTPTAALTLLLADARK